MTTAEMAAVLQKTLIHRLANISLLWLVMAVIFAAALVSRKKKVQAGKGYILPFSAAALILLPAMILPWTLKTMRDINQAQFSCVHAVFTKTDGQSKGDLFGQDGFLRTENGDVRVLLSPYVDTPDTNTSGYAWYSDESKVLLLFEEDSN